MKSVFFVFWAVWMWRLLSTANCENARDNEKDTRFWLDKGHKELLKQINKKPNKKFAKNVILFLGDGMSIPTLTAARVFKGELQGKSGSDGEFLSFEKFPYSGLSRTYCVDSRVADSACSATAYLTGVKTNRGAIGVNGRVAFGDCVASQNISNRVDGIATWAQNAGKSTGFVTTTSVTDATPAGTYAYTAKRKWESDADVMKDGWDSKTCEDIAEQLILRRPGKNFNVIMGGGSRNFIPDNQTDEGGNKGKRKDYKNLIRMWIQDKKNRHEKYAYVWNKKGLVTLQDVPNYLLGIFGSGHLDYYLQKKKHQPSLSEMTSAAIKILQKNPKGYFLLVEGGLIDMAHHNNKAHLALSETVEFSKAVETAVNMTNEDDTLIVVMADHAHTMSLIGYPSRHNCIFGFSGKGTDGLLHTTINYAGGPGFNFKSGKRYDMTNDDTGKANYTFPSGVPLRLGSHGGDDVAVFARGPHSHIFTGAYEESYIPIAMAYASGLRI